MMTLYLIGWKSSVSASEAAARKLGVVGGRAVGAQNRQMETFFTELRKAVEISFVSLVGHGGRKSVAGRRIDRRRR
jgi:hypothetical protein